MRCVCLVKKPIGITSGEITRQIAKKFGKKAGHTGSLDKNAEGLLIVLLGRCLKVCDIFKVLDKEYTGIIELHSDVDEDSLKKTVKSFVGEILQIPPRRSAVARKVRVRKVYYFDVKKMGRKVYFKIGCEAGTYIRKIAHDLGVKLGVRAHLAKLKRISIGPFKLEEAKEPDKVKPIDLGEALLRFLPKIEIKKDLLERVLNGVPFRSEIKMKGNVAIFYDSGLIAIGTSKGFKIKPKIVFKIKF